jgi:NADH-quinone oxidoreductase subunit M
MLLLLIVFSPVIAAILIVCGAPPRKTAMIAAGAIFLFSISLLSQFAWWQTGFQFVTSSTISADLGIHFATGVDGLSLTLVLLTSVVTLAAVWFAERVEPGFYACLLLISAGALGAFCSLDLIFFYAFHELALIPTFLLIGIWGTGNRSAAAWKITIYLALGSFVLLIGLILLYETLPAASRTFDIRGLTAAAIAHQIPAQAQKNIYLLLLIGFGILISLFPFHTWAPEAYAAAPAPVAMMHAGFLKKFGLYGLLRLALPLLPEGARYWNHLLVVLLLGNIIYIGLVTIAQKRLDWMLGYSSVMHMGYIFLGIASGNVLGTTGAAALIFAHGLSIALLFAIAGEIRKRTGTLVFEDLGGLAKVMPFAGLAFGFAAFAAIGLPGFANFAGEIMIFFGAFQTGWEVQRFHIFQIATVLALWGVVISAVYMLRAYRKIFMGTMADRWNNLVDLRVDLRLPAALLIAALVWFGFFPQLFVRTVTPAFKVYLSSEANNR